jgi:hypothetical protein
LLLRMAVKITYDLLPHLAKHYINIRYQVRLLVSANNVLQKV